MKTCTACKQAKPFEEFYIGRANKDKRQPQCIICTKIRMKLRGKRTTPEYSKEWRKRNPGYDALRFSRNPERYKKQYWKNPEAKRAKMRLWSKVNPEKAAANAAKRRAMKLQATPVWLNRADHAEIDGQYHFASIMSKITGRKYEVDHEVPLQGRNVCGLHVPNNLQTITKSENSSKHNNFSEVSFDKRESSLRELIQEVEQLVG